MEGKVVNLSYEELEAILLTVVSSNPKKEELQNCYNVLKDFKKNINSVEQFLKQIKMNKNDKIRQLAAILLNRKIEKHWPNFNDQIKLEIKKLLLELIRNEKNYLVSKAIAHLIFRVAKLSLVSGEWNDLLDYIFSDPSSYSKEQANIFELNLYVIAELIDICSFYLKNKMELIKNILQLSLNFGSPRMKENATKCLGNLVRTLEEKELKYFVDLIPLIFKEMPNFTEETILHIYETLCDFHINSLWFFEDSWDNIMLLTIKFLNSDEFSGNSKLVLAEFIQMISEHKKKLFTKNNCAYLRSIIEVGFKLASEADQSYNEDGYSPFYIGMSIIETFSQSISSKYVYPICSEWIQKLVFSQNEFERKAGVAAMGRISEGCNEKVLDSLEDYVNCLTQIFLKDTSTKVREAAIVSMDHLTKNFTEIVDYHDKIIPMLLSGLNDPTETIVEYSLIEMKYFCKSIDIEIEPYLQELFNKISVLLDHHKSLIIKQEALSALCAVINSGNKLVQNALLPVLTKCKEIIESRTKEEEQTLRANALNCVAEIAFVIKLEAFKPYLQYFSQIGLDCLNTKRYELVEAAFSYFGSIAQIMGEPFADNLPILMPIALELLKDDSGVNRIEKKDEYGLDSDSDDEENEDDDVNVNEYFIDAKCANILAVTNFARACPKAFIPYFPPVISLLDMLYNFIHDNIRLEVISAYESLLVSLHISLSGNDSNVVAQDTHTFWEQDVFFKYEEIIKEDDEKQCVVKALEGLYDIFDYFEPKAILNENKMIRISSLMNLLLNYEAGCQRKNYKDLQDEEELDHDEKILGGVIDLMLILSEKMGDEFHYILEKVYPNLIKYTGKDRSENDRSMAFGCLADVFKYCKISAPFYVETLLSLVNQSVYKNTKKKNEELLRHSAYLIGILFYAIGEKMRSAFENSLNILKYIYENTKEQGKDNVLAALSRVISALKLTPNDAFFNEIIQIIYTNCPLKSDAFENVTIVNLSFYLSQIMDIKPIFQSIMETIKYVILNEVSCGTNKELIKEIKVFLETLNSKQDIKVLLDTFIENIQPVERERFVNTIKNC